MSCGIGCRHGSDLALLWLWCRLAAVALIRPLAWEPPYAASAALKRQKKKNYPAPMTPYPVIKTFNILGDIMPSFLGLYIHEIHMPIFFFLIKIGSHYICCSVACFFT